MACLSTISGISEGESDGYHLKKMGPDQPKLAVNIKFISPQETSPQEKIDGF